MKTKWHGRHKITTHLTHRLQRFRKQALPLIALVAGAASSVYLGGCRTSSGPAPDERSAVGGAEPAKLVLGFVPSQEAGKMAETAKPLSDFLSAELKIPVTSFTATTYVGLVEGMGSGKVDIGMLAPLGYVLANQQYGASVILRSARHGHLTYHSMFIARADSGIKTLADAKGKKIAFVDPASASGYLFPAAYLKAHNMDSESYFKREFFAGGHDKCVMAVYNGDVDVAAVFDDARDNIEKNKAYADVKTKVIKIGQTGEIPNDTVSVRKGLDPKLVVKIRDAFLKFSKSPKGAETLKELYSMDGLSPATNADYEVVRKTAEVMEVGGFTAQDRKNSNSK